MNTKIKCEEQREKIDMLVVENNNLKDKIHEQEDEMKKVKRENKKMQNVIDSDIKNKEMLEKVQGEVKWLEVQLKSKEGEVEE